MFQGIETTALIASNRSFSMRAIKRARKIIEQDPTSATSRALTALILALETDTDFSLKKLYALNIDDFDLMIELMRDWRLDRYYEGKTKAISTAIQADKLS